MPSAVRQLGFVGMCTHNPDMQTCHFKKCDTVLFGKVYLLQLEFGDRVETMELCSLACYRKMDACIESILTSGEDFVAVIDHGEPEDWF